MAPRLHFAVIAVIVASIGVGCEDKSKQPQPTPAEPPPPAPLAVIDAAPPALVDDIPVRLGAPRVCDTPQSRASLCACLFDALEADDEFGFDDEHDDALEDREPVPSCKVASSIQTKELAAWRVAAAGARGDDVPHGVFLVAQVANQFASVGTLRDDLGRSRQRLSALAVTEMQRRGVDSVGYVLVTATERDVDDDGAISTETTTTQVTLCPLPISPTVGCPLQLPTRSVTTARVESPEPEHLADFRAMYGQGPPAKRETVLRFDVSSLGVATIALESGAPTDLTEGLVGRYQLYAMPR